MGGRTGVKMLSSDYQLHVTMICLINTFWLAAVCRAVSAVPSFPLTTTKVTTCDTLGNVHRLSCDEGVIVVQAALYGRQNRETCSEGWTNNLFDINCSQEGTKDILKKSCDGKTTCEVTANAFRFSDPCHGTYKYLESTYACVGKNPAPCSRVVCEQSTAHLRCDQGQVIRVHSAEYGRRDTTTCSSGRPSYQLQNVNCVGSATNKVAQMCNDQSGCFVQASNSVFGDPCGGTYKYLKITYICVRNTQIKPAPSSRVVCEQSTAHLRCDQGQVIRVHSAEYGRRDTTTCSFGRPSYQLQNVNCVGAATNKVAQMCNDQSSCFVQASNSVFGDPCGGTYKYLKVTYSCQNADENY